MWNFEEIEKEFAAIDNLQDRINERRFLNTLRLQQTLGHYEMPYSNFVVTEIIDQAATLEENSLASRTIEQALIF